MPPEYMVSESLLWSMGLSCFSVGLSLGIVLMRLANWLDGRKSGRAL